MERKHIKDYDPITMTRATWQDIDRIMNQLWGDYARDQYKMIAPVEDDEILDLTQLPDAPAEQTAQKDN
jgi:hypothetical protein